METYARFWQLDEIIVVQQKVQAIEFAIDLGVAPSPKSFCFHQDQILPKSYDKVDVFLISLNKISVPSRQI